MLGSFLNNDKKRPYRKKKTKDPSAIEAAPPKDKKKRRKTAKVMKPYARTFYPSEIERMETVLKRNTEEFGKNPLNFFPIK